MAKSKTKAPPPEKTHPTHKASLGALQLAVWANEHTTDAGEVRTFHTVTLERNYKDKHDAWQKTSQLRESDLGDAIALLQNAQQHLLNENT